MGGGEANQKDPVLFDNNGKLFPSDGNARLVPAAQTTDPGGVGVAQF